MRCKSCLAENNQGAKECSNCGISLVDLEMERIIAECQEKIKEEIAGEKIDIDITPEKSAAFIEEDSDDSDSFWNRSGNDQGDEVQPVVATDNMFEPPVTRRVLSGYTEEDAVIKYRDLTENIIFELKSKNFVLFGNEIPWKKRVIADSERGWMSAGLLKVIEAIEKNGKEKVSTPHDDFSWWAILGEVIKRLEAEKVMAPVQMIKQDLIVLHGRIEALRFVMPSSNK